MKNKLPISIALFVLFLFVILFDAIKTGPVVVFRKEAVFGELSLRGKNYAEGRTILKEKLYQPIYLDLESTSQAKTLSELGVSINETKLMNLTKTCPSRIIKVFCEKVAQDAYSADALEVDTQQLDPYLNQLENDLQFMVGNTIVSFDDYSFRPLSENARIVIERDDFYSKENLAKLIGQERLSVSLSANPLDSREEQENVTQSLIENMSYPFLIKYGRAPVYIPAETVREFIKVEERNGLVYGFILSQPISDYLTSIANDYASDEVKIFQEESVDAIRRALLFRASNYEINNAVILPLEGMPKTDGSLADVYLELIKSQQRLYRFESGELVKTYIVSTGLTWETPTGEFEVLGKQKMTISYYDNWYMPNYLPIGDIKGYRFGFHEIPYHMDGAGNIYSRDANTMGSPATGGCIQLGKKDSLELFEWAEVGTPVYIYE